MLFLLLANLTWLQAFRADPLNADARNRRTQLARFDHPRGDILTFDGTAVARSVRSSTSMHAYKRTYPDGERYAAITGYVSLFGSAGLERLEGPVLSGDDPRVRVRSLMREGGRRGADVRLTVDSRVQRAAYDALRATGRPGAAVAIDPATGAILALASYPSYDPNRYATFDVAKLTATDRGLRADPGQPLLNRATSQTYPPGSTFKVVTAAAALASGEYTPATRVEAPRRLLLPASSVQLPNAGGQPCGDGQPPLAYAFQVSCNTAFARIGLQLGQDVLRDQAEAFGFNATDLTVPLAVAESVFPARLDHAQTAMAAIGQHDDRATPLLIAMFSAAVANNGVLMRPHLVEEIRMSDRTVIGRAEPVEYRTVLDVQTARALTAMMVTVAQPGGTGSGAALPGIAVAAKTGTAENVPGAPDHAVFTAFAPAEAPVVAVGVVVENGGAGGDVAAPVARAVLQAALG
ncbi:penicillin-binding protein 2 [Nonomuraea sp. NPDC050310]|uniref:peptidoglycan D,D-transpeptidase FtsI family protein n=1 Tax=Nonomuraea sp. NPDC050310 TaxID=3154935 RepID=UPI0033F048B0